MAVYSLYPCYVFLVVVTITRVCGEETVTRKHPGDTATVTWEQADTVTTTSPTAVLFYLTSTTVLTVNRFPNGTWIDGTVGSDFRGRVSGDIREEEADYGFQLRELNLDTDAEKYRIQYLTAFEDEYDPLTQVLFIYGKPDVSLSVSPDYPDYPEAGGQATLICSSTSTSKPEQYKPDFEYTWWMNGTRLEHSEAVLGISVRKEHHNTVYRCEGREQGSNLADDDSVTLDVTYGPVSLTINASNPVTYANGSYVVVTCTADCNPPCDIQWERDDEVESGDGVLTITDIEREHDGVYSCVATNTRNNNQHNGNLKIIVHFPPDVELSISSDPIFDGSQTTLWCNVTSNPNTGDFTWRRLGNVITAGVTSGINWSKLELVPATCLDTDLYSCEADNGIHYATIRELRISLLSPPVYPRYDPPERVVAAATDESAMFSVEFCSNPVPDWAITLPNTTHGLDDVNLLSNGTIFTIDIDHVKERHYGTYTMRGQNQYGQATAAFTLEPKGPPHPPTQLRAVQSTCVSVTVEWKPGFDGGSTQTFLVAYRNRNNGSDYSTESIDDGEDIIKHKIITGIQGDTVYIFNVQASNIYGQTPGSEQEHNTPVCPSITVDDIEIVPDRNVALITWTLTGAVTHVVVLSCNVHVAEGDETSGACLNTTVTDLQSFPAEVNLPSGTAFFTFEFLLFDGQDLVKIYPASTTNENIDIVGIAVGVTVTILFILVLPVVLVLYKRGILKFKRPNKRDNTTEGNTAAVYVNTTLSSALGQIQSTTDEAEQPGNGDYESLDTEGLAPLKATTYDNLKQSDPISSLQQMKFVQKLSGNRSFEVWKINMPGTKIHVAKKLKEQNTCLRRYILGQGKAMGLLEHGNVIKLAGISNGDLPYLLMEYATAGTLNTYLLHRNNGGFVNTQEGLSNGLLQGFAHQCAAGAAALASLETPVLHYSLSSHHVLLDSNRVCKLTGFATAEVVRDREAWEKGNGIERPVRWMSPETLLKSEHTTQSDVWSFGVLLWEIYCNGENPYSALNAGQVENFVSKNGKLGQNESCSDEMYNLMERCWLKLPRSRPSFGDICHELSPVSDGAQYEEIGPH